LEKYCQRKKNSLKSNGAAKYLKIFPNSFKEGTLVSTAKYPATKKHTVTKTAAGSSSSPLEVEFSNKASDGKFSVGNFKTKHLSFQTKMALMFQTSF